MGRRGWGWDIGVHGVSCFIRWSSSAQTTWGISQGRPVDPWQGAVCGACAGAVAAAMTTPLDVAKTRVMLAKVRPHGPSPLEEGPYMHVVRPVVCPDRLVRQR